MARLFYSINDGTIRVRLAVFTCVCALVRVYVHGEKDDEEKDDAEDGGGGISTYHSERVKGCVGEAGEDGRSDA